MPFSPLLHYSFPLKPKQFSKPSPYNFTQYHNLYAQFQFGQKAQTQKRSKLNMGESSIAKSVHKPGLKAKAAASHGAAKISSHGETKSAAAASNGRGENDRGCVVADKRKISLLPQFQGIDERAEEFIAKMRNDMKLEREQSIREFEEMLKRSA